MSALTQQAERTVDAIACSGPLPRRGARRGERISPSSYLARTLPTGGAGPSGGAGAAVGETWQRPGGRVMSGDTGFAVDRVAFSARRASPSWGR